MGQKEEVQAVVQDLQQAGFSVVRTGRDHWRVIYGNKTVGYLPGTPRSPRWRMNALKEIDRNMRKQHDGGSSVPDQ